MDSDLNSSTVKDEPLYAPLGEHEVRLLIILPGPVDNDLCCKLERFSLNESPKFLALSYRWDMSTGQHVISCNDNPLPISPTINAFLRRIRHVEEKLILWIDAICINQQDKNERSAQVKIMGKIYRTASKVLIWLGEAGEESRLAFPLMHKLCHLRRSESSWLTEKKDVLSQRRARVPPAYDPAYKAIYDILSREWFERMWIIQEVALAQHATVMCGNETIEWDDFVDAITYTAEIKLPFLFEGASAANKVFMLCAARNQAPDIQKTGLLAIMLRFRESKASDPRDKIFALYGLAAERDVKDLDIEPDFEKMSIKELYMTFAIQMVNRSQSLDILSIPKKSRSNVGEKLPSWVPDWTTGDDRSNDDTVVEGTATAIATKNNAVIEDTITRTLMDFQSGNPNYSRFRATRDSSYGQKLSLAQEFLNVEGITLDTISSISEHEGAGYFEKNASNILELAQRIVQSCQETLGWEKLGGANDKRPYVTGETSHDAYWQTIITGCPPEEVDQIRDEFARYRKSTRLERTMGFLNLSKSPWLCMAMIMLWGFFRPATAPGAAFAQRLQYVGDRKLMRTLGGYLGLVPKSASIGDHIVLLKGGRVPYVLREAGSNKFELIGECYVHGVMHGEAFDAERCKDMIII